MIEYGYISRNVTNPNKFKEIRDKRLKLKEERNPMQLPLKIVINSTYGAMKDKYNPLYDPLMANNVCIAGQLLILDLIEKLEPYGKLIQSNTDGIFMKVKDMDTVEKIKNVAKEWEKRTRLDLEWGIYNKIYQKDVNNYIIINEKGKYESKGSYVKKLNDIDYDLPIINKALVDYFVKNKPIGETIHECVDLREFQKIVKVTSLYKYAVHNDNKMSEKVFRVFASNKEEDGTIYKVKDENKIEKIASTPEKCFIYNDNVKGKEIPTYLDKEYYIDLANKRLDDFLNERKKLSKVEKINNLKLQFSKIIDQTDHFYNVLEKNKKMRICNKNELKTLIELDVFSKYGLGNKLLNFTYYFDILYGKKSPRKKTIEKSIEEESILRLIEVNSEQTETSYKNIDFEKTLKEIFSILPNEDVFYVDKIKSQLEYNGNITYTSDNIPKDHLYIINLNELNNIMITAYCINNGKVSHLYIPKNTYRILPCREGDVIKAKQYERKYAQKIIKKDNNGVNILGEDKNKIKYWLNSYELIYR